MKALLPLLVLLMACSTTSITRIGPARNPKKADCDVEILSAGEKPSRPYQDVGVVSLKNCHDYTAGPCRKWLQDKACYLGGDVAYNPVDPTRDGRDDHIAGVVTVSVTVGAYVSTVPTGTSDPVLDATPINCDEVIEDEVEEPEDQMCRE